MVGGIIGAPAQRWREFCRLEWQGGTVHFLKADTEVLWSMPQDIPEPVQFYAVRDLHTKLIIPNLAWLIPLALDKEGTRALTFEPTDLPQGVFHG